MTLFPQECPLTSIGKEMHVTECMSLKSDKSGVSTLSGSHRNASSHGESSIGTRPLRREQLTLPLPGHAEPASVFILNLLQHPDSWVQRPYLLK